MKTNLLRIISSLIICLLGFPGIANAQSIPFEDHIGHDFQEAIEYLYTNDIIEGYPNNTFKPDGDINRAELVKILVASNFEPAEYSAFAEESCFPDVNADEWYAEYICFAKSREIIQGYPDGNFMPENNVNLIESLKIIYEGIGLAIDNPDAVFKFKYYSPAMTAGYLPEVLKGEFEKEVTRAEVSEIIYRILQNQDKELLTYENLNLTVYKQKYYASCSMAALASALSIKINVSEDQIIDKMIQLNQYPANEIIVEDGTNIWDDPNLVFVGDYNGLVSINMSKIKGFGFLNGPLEKLTREWARNSEKFENVSLSYIAQQIEEKNPVIVFANVNAKDGAVIIEEPSPYTIQWQISGTQENIRMPMYKHNLVIEGFKGTVESPISFSIIDPFYGEKSEMSSTNLSNILEGYNFSGIVVKF